MSFDYTQEEITRLAKENNFTVAGIEKVMRLSNILNDLNNQPEFSGKLLLKGGTAIARRHRGCARHLRFRRKLLVPGGS